MVLHQHGDDLDALLHRGGQLGGHHQVRAVADHHEDVAVRAGQPDAEPAGDLIAHAGVAVLDVVALRVAGPPELVQVSRHRAGRTHHDVAGIGQLVDQADHLVLGEQPVGAGFGVSGSRRAARSRPRRRSARRILAA